MSYKYNASDANNLVKKGDYEAIIERMEVKTLPSGKSKLTVSFRIRDDVEQQYKNKWMFKDIWESKDEPEIFDRKQINKLLGTQEIKDGQEFEHIGSIMKFLEGKPLIIHIDIGFDDYRGEDVNIISYYKKSKVVPQQATQPIPNVNAPKPEENIIDDEKLPF